MKNKTLTLIKHKLQWLALLVALLGVSQGAFAESYVIHGNFNNSGWKDYNCTDGKVTINLNKATTYEFGVKVDSSWKTNGGTMIRSNCTGWSLDGNSNTKITADIDGDYVFYVYKDGDTYRLTVTYPTTSPSRCYNGTEYMYFDINGSYFSQADAVPNVSFDGGNTYADAEVVDAEKKIYRLLVPAGCYNSMKVRRHGNDYWNQCDISLADIENHNEFIVGNDWNRCSHSWGDYEEQGCTTPTAAQYSVSNNTYTYDGTVKTVSITPVSDAGAVTKTYYGGVEGGKTNAGTYKVTIDSEAGSTYCAASGLEVGNLVINKANQAELTLSSSASSACVAGGSITFSTTGGSGDGAVTYAITSGTGGSISGNTLTATQAGTFTVQATKAASTNYNEKKSNEVTVTFKGATLTVSPSSVSTNPYAVTTLTATSTPAASVTWSTTTGYFVDENNKKSDVPVANSVKVKPGREGGNVTATVVSDGCTTNTIVPVTVSADTQDCQ